MQLRTILPVLILFSSFATAVCATERWETLEAIHLVENPHNSTRVGAHGELGPYQFRLSTWRMYSRKPFTLAVNRQESDKVAVMHYDWIKTGLEQNGIEASAYNIAMAWNGGLNSVISGRTPQASRLYAEHVFNLANEIKRNQVASLGQ